jgi:hypothetical protein
MLIDLRPFIDYIEKPFRDRGLRTAVLVPPTASLSAVIRRQILEGVQAIIKLYRRSRETGRIPLTIFDRTGAANDVRFEGIYKSISISRVLTCCTDYEDLDPATAAEVAVRAKAKQAVITPQVQLPFNLATNFPLGQYGQQLPQQVTPQTATPVQPQNLANLISSLDGPALQKLLSAMQQTPGAPPVQAGTIPQSPASASQPDIQALLGSISKQQSGSIPPQPQHSPHAAPPGFGYPPNPPPPAQGAYPNFPGYTNQPQHGGPPQQQYQPNIPLPGPANVQGVLEQIGRWKQ